MDHQVLWDAVQLDVPMVLAAVAVFRKVNQITRGWAGAFHYGNSSRVFDRPPTFVRNRLRRWLWRKYNRTHELFEQGLNGSRAPGQAGGPCHTNPSRLRRLGRGQ